MHFKNKEGGNLDLKSKKSKFKSNSPCWWNVITIFPIFPDPFITWNDISRVPVLTNAAILKQLYRYSHLQSRKLKTNSIFVLPWMVLNGLPKNDLIPVVSQII